MHTIPNYQINEKIYESANSLVYRAIRDADNQPVILKVLKEDYPTPKELTRYRQEYEITKSLNIAGVINTYSLEKFQNTLVIVLEDFGGESLKQLMTERCLTVKEFLPRAIQIANSLGLIHAANIIHKDINPSNIVFEPATEQLKIIDFGIATVLPRENPTLKNPKQLEGTLAYISPEQTGRMNRALDYRTDLYSLGITFYEMLTGQLPFNSDSPMELVHCHLAKTPAPVSEINPDVPQVLSEMVRKLMAKNVEERYQSAFGVKADLEKCVENLDNLDPKNLFSFQNLESLTFELAQNDFSGKFKIPQKLYGRENEVNTLLQAFERVTEEGKTPTGKGEMMLVAGYSGVGKTALVHEVHKPMTEKHGHFAAGKFDQYQRNLPYSALTQAFNNFCNYLLTESAEELIRWRDKILTTVGNNGQVLIDVIGQLEFIIGPQPSVVHVGHQEAQNRFNLVFQNFFRAICQKEHPLVLFIDDLQWADSASLALLKRLMTDTDNQYFLLIGAYRDNEVDAAHPLMITVEELKKECKITLHEIRLQNLSHQHVNTLIADALKCGPYDATALTDLVYEKTQGNAFFTHEFLKSLSEQALLVFDFKTQKWQWPVDQIAALEMTDNVVELMADKIAQLSEKTQTALKLAACIGNQFDLKTLSVIGQHSQTNTLAFLFDAIKEGLVLPLDQNYKQLEKREHAGVDTRFKFQHDRVQQAAYSLISDDEKKTRHLRIARLLVANLKPKQREEKIFEIVSQFNNSLTLITDSEEQLKVAQLNLTASQKAKESNAYKPAYDYLQNALHLLGEDAWHNHYELTLALYGALSQVAFLTTNFIKMDTYIKAVLFHANNTLDKVAAYNVKIQHAIALGQQNQAWQLGFEILSLLGQSLSTELLADFEIESVMKLPNMNDAVKLSAMQILNLIITPAWASNAEVFKQICLTMINLSFSNGLCEFSAVGYASYGGILCGQGEIEKGYQFGKLGVDLSEKFNAKPLQIRVQMLFYSTVMHWRKSVRETVAAYYQASQPALEMGDIEYACFALVEPDIYQFLMGSELKKLNEKYPNTLKRVSQLQQDFHYNFLIPYYQAALNLLGKAELTELTGTNLPGKADLTELTGTIFNKQKLLPQFIEEQQITLCCATYLAQTLLAFIFRDIEKAYQNALLTEKYKEGAGGMFFLPVHSFYCSLALLAKISASVSDNSPEHQQLLNHHQAQLKHWATHAPCNCQHKYDLVGAETARVLGNHWQAAQLYEKAIAGAKQNKYFHEEALAYELAAEFYLQQGLEKFAQTYMKEAHYRYQLWGALAKITDLEHRYPQLIAPVASVKTALTTSMTRMASASTSQTLSKELDLDTLMKAAQTLSGEIVLSQLLEKMMHTVIENAGAQQGLLILEKRKGTMEKAPSESDWVIEAQATVDKNNVPMLQSIELHKASVSPEIVHYVLRTQQQVVLNDATAQGPFTQTTYIKKTQPKSILCLPLVNQGQISGILYLENNLTTGAFTPERLTVLKLLSSQMAISLENAFVYNNLEELVAERTQELSTALDNLKATQNQLIESEKMAALGGLVAGVAHEINTPVGVGITAASTLDKETQAFVEQFNQGKLKRSALQAYLDTAQQGSQLILSNLQQAAELVQSFKQVAVDQTHLSQRQFAVKEYFKETILNLMPKLKQTNHRLTINGNDTVTINSYPGALSQVVNNLVTNSIAHAYQPGESGQLQFDISAHDSKLTIEYSDNGCGIAPENLSKIFEPFFTTARSQGGSGLGLHIVYNLITQKLKGTIRCESRVGKGTTFIIELPI
jgi:predicted ATPase/signal transduction histidine kinase/tRNA A-37 threonylcarbamoyl transferase component Bud32